MRPGIGTLGILGTALGAGLPAATGGCVASGGDESIVVLRNVVPSAGCVLTSMTSETGVSQGALDTEAHTGYVFSAQLKSRITAVAGAEDQRTIFVQGANVDIAFPGSTLFSDAELATLKSGALTHFKSEFSALLPPNGVISDVPFELIPAELVAMIAAKPGFTSASADASFTVLGQLAGGDVTSQTYHYPVTIVKQVLLIDKGDCSMVLASFMPRTGDPCNPGQDSAVDCCEGPDGRVCPAVGTMK